MPKPKAGGIPLRVHNRQATGSALHRAHLKLSALLTATHHPECRNPRVDVKKIQRRFVRHPDRMNKVLAVSVGPTRPRSAEGAIAPPGSPSLRIYVDQEMGRKDLAAWVQENYGDDVLKDRKLPFEVIASKPAKLLTNAERMRPPACGISCSRGGGLYGTIGFYGRGRGTDKTVYLVSNNHILADRNNGQPGDSIYQPSTHDGGTTLDLIAKLHRWTIINPNQPNYLDCASAIVEDPSRIRYDMVQFINGAPSYFTVGTTPVEPGPRLGKCGRTTEVKAGRLQSRTGSVVVDMGGWKAVFHNQIEIADETYPFSDDGDSGALVWNFDEQRQPVGLLFARLGTSTFANPIQPVLDALMVDILQ
jgi:hypothetical protein